MIGMTPGAGGMPNLGGNMGGILGGGNLGQGTGGGMMGMGGGIMGGQQGMGGGMMGGEAGMGRPGLNEGNRERRGVGVRGWKSAIFPAFSD